jgi:quercetin dioxygenase-like cupin family protein
VEGVLHATRGGCEPGAFLGREDAEGGALRERFFCDLYCLAPGQSQRVHSHAESDKVYYVLSGRATIQVGEEVGEVESGVAVLAPAGLPPGVDNRSAAPVTLLVFMAPRPEHG